MIEIKLDELPPSINHAYYFIKSKKGRTFKVKTKQCKEFVERVKTTTQLQNPNLQLIEGKITVRMKFKTPDHRRRDLDNLQKITLDALIGLIWKDDSQINNLQSTKKTVKGISETIIEVISSEPEQTKLD